MEIDLISLYANLVLIWLSINSIGYIRSSSLMKRVLEAVNHGSNSDNPR
jgi:hypothetical protein